ACKTECPAGVDMASLKSEFLAGYWTRHGTPLRARALANVEGLASWSSRLAPMSNWIASAGPVRWLNELLLDIDRRRPLPRWKSTTFDRWLVKNKQPAAPNGKPVAFFNDTFMNYYNPEVGIA